MTARPNQLAKIPALTKTDHGLAALRQRTSLVPSPELWCAALTQHDIPAIFGLDPQFSPADVKREKLSRLETRRSGQAFATMSLVATTLAMSYGWQKLRAVRFVGSREVESCSVQGALALPRGQTRSVYGLILPIAVPAPFQEFASVGWPKPQGDDDVTAIVPVAARLMAAYAMAVSGASWVRLATVSSDFVVSLYRLGSISHSAQKVMARAAGWWLTHINGDASADALACFPPEVLPSLPAEANLASLCAEGLRLQTEIAALQQRLRATTDQLLIAMGDRRVVLDRHGRERARVLTPAPIITADPADLPADHPFTVTYPSPDVNYA